MGHSASPSEATNLLIYIGMVPLEGDPVVPFGVDILLIVFEVASLERRSGGPIGLAILLMSLEVTPLEGDSADPIRMTRANLHRNETIRRGTLRAPLE